MLGAFAVCLHATGCSLKETKAFFALFGVNQSPHLTVSVNIGQMTAYLTRCRRVVADETVVKINGEWYCMNTAIGTETKLSLDIDILIDIILIKRLYFSANWPRNTISQGLCFSLMATGIGL